MREEHARVWITQREDFSRGEIIIAVYDTSQGPTRIHIHEDFGSTLNFVFQLETLVSLASCTSFVGSLRRHVKVKV